MTKEELIHITLQQLSENFKSSPENFRLEDAELGQTNGSFPGPTIVWQFKVATKEGEAIADPLNASRTIMVTYNKVSNQISCLIFFREVNTSGSAIMPDTQAIFQCSQFLSFHRTYRGFMKLRQELIELRKQKEYVDYLRKLTSIFPSTHEDELFK